MRRRHPSYVQEFARLDEEAVDVFPAGAVVFKMICPCGNDHLQVTGKPDGLIEAYCPTCGRRFALLNPALHPALKETAKREKETPFLTPAGKDRFTVWASYDHAVPDVWDEAYDPDNVTGATLAGYCANTRSYFSLYPQDDS